MKKPTFTFLLNDLKKLRIKAWDFETAKNRALAKTGQKNIHFLKLEL